MSRNVKLLKDGLVYDNYRTNFLLTSHILTGALHIAYVGYLRITHRIGWGETQ